MATKPFETIEVRARPAWRRWLSAHHATKAAIWLVFCKGLASPTTLSYDDAVEEALCFGWVDSLIRRIDETRYARKFTPRKTDSKWSTSNRRRYADLERRGLLAPPGLERRPTLRSGDAPRPSVSRIPFDIERTLKSRPAAWTHFERLAPSYRRAYIAWIGAARRAATRRRRLREALRLLAAGRRLGLK